MMRITVTGLAALLLAMAPAEAKKVKEKKIEVQETTLQEPQNSYGSRQEYAITASGDQYIFRCWSPLPGISDAHTFAMLRNTPVAGGMQCVDHFYFKEGDSYCSFEHLRKKQEETVQSGVIAIEAFSDEKYLFDFAPPVEGVYALHCISPLEEGDLPNAAEGRRNYVFADSLGKVCVFRGMPENGEWKFEEKTKNTDNKSKKK